MFSEEIIPVVKNVVMITGFVFVMMLVIEYVNVQTQGIWQRKLTGSKWKQYLIAAALGAIPGCLGAFVAVALFSHRMLSFGAIVTAMIATSGDEAFVMFAMFPQKALLVTFLLFGIGIAAGYLADAIPWTRRFADKFSERSFPLHEEDHCICFPKGNIFHALLRPSIYRIVIVVLVLSLLLAVSLGVVGGAKDWMRVSIMLVIGFSLFVVLTVPDHFLKKHLWDHIVRVHLLRIFLWTLGTLLIVHYAMQYVDLNALVGGNILVVLLIAVLVGIIPESGPHLVFVALFAQGTVPFSILLASSISQDGHGMLPLLAESKRSFLAVKFVNIVVAFLVGLAAYAMGF